MKDSIDENLEKIAYIKNFNNFLRKNLISLG